MKIHPLNCLIAVMLGALLTYGIVAIDANTMKGTTGIGAFVFLSCTLTSALGITFEQVRTGINVRIVSLVFFAVALVTNLVFALLALSNTSYVITCGVLFLLYVMIAQMIFSAKQ